MKKFVIAFCVILVAVLVGRHLVLYENLYIDFSPNAPVDAQYSADEEYIYDNTGAEQKKISIRGVVLDSVKPGHYTTDYNVTADEYDTWLTQIADMGANTITVDGIMDSEFYDALEKYNLASQTPLYLIQGVRIESYDMNNANDVYGNYDELMEDVHRTVDVIHGTDVFAVGRMEAGGTYTTDVSKWTIGYILGNEWVPYTVAYSDNKLDLPTDYQGEYFYTAPEASNTEVFIANVMDSMMQYESKRYKTQRLITFNSSYDTDPLEYSATVQIQIEKVAQMNIDHIMPGEKTESGLFAGYIMRAGMEEFLSCLSDNDVLKYIDIIPLIDPESIYGGYVEFLNLMHDVPVVVTSYGHSTARVADSITHANEEDDSLTEEEQGEEIVSNYYEFLEDGCQGAVIANWQDNWSRTTWNTNFATDESRQMYWHDVQSKDQSNGILAFDTSDGGEVCYVDGDVSEWQASDVVVSQDGYTLSARYDEAYLYLMAQGNDIQNQSLVIPMDITPKTGSLSVRYSEIKMTHQSDFVIFINGVEGSEILVQERYDATRAGYEELISTVNPFVYPPSPTGNLFVPIRVVSEKALDPSVNEADTIVEELYLLNTQETGQLEYGNANPNAYDYNSLADYYFGDDVMEIRVPWQLINFYDPSVMKVHDDYYPVYGVEGISIDSINVGVSTADSENRINMEPIELIGWDNTVTYEERLKKSYDIIQAAWLKERENER